MEGQWQTISLPFSDFIPVFRARTLKDGTRLDPSQVSSVQLMLSKCVLRPRRLRILTSIDLAKCRAQLEVFHSPPCSLGLGLSLIYG